MKKIIPFILLFIYLVSSNEINAQKQAKKPSKSSIMIGHDIFLPLFGKAAEESDIRKTIQQHFFIPVVMYEFTFNNRWWFGVKAGHQKYSETKHLPVDGPAPGTFHSFYTNETIWGGNVYCKYIMRQNKKVQPYLGGGFGYQVIRQKEINRFASGTETKNSRKYGEFSILFKGGIMYSLSKRLALFSEGEYRPMPAVWVTGIAIKL
jgi:opacity protein-like surface antigen